MFVFNPIDSDDFHHVCAITEPPLHYMNATSKLLSHFGPFIFLTFFAFSLIVRVVNAVNEREKVRVAAYTFDAGPNGVIYLLKQHVPLFLAAALYVFPGKPENHDYLRNISPSDVLPLPADLQSLLDQVKSDAISSDSELKYILGTRLGPGPQQKVSKSSPPSSFNFGGSCR
jgi:diphosphomevalonate decarboxylase